MKLKKKLSLLAISGVLLASSLSAFAINGSSSKLGTNLALGSPLVNDNFNPEDFDPQEMIIFGIFLSNFPIPLIDNYETAFSRGVGGSDGFGYRALEFGAGGKQETMTNMLDEAIRISKSGYKEIYFDTGLGGVVEDTGGSEGETGGSEGDTGSSEGETGDSGSEKPPSKKQAKFKDLMEIASGGVNVKIDDSSPTGKEIYELGPQVKPYRFYVYTDYSQRADATVFDYSESYDTTMLLANFSRVIAGTDKDRTKQFNDKLEELIASESANLYLDPFGNIVVKDPTTQAPLIVYPAASNQHLTERKSQNLVTSVFTGPSYLDASESNYKLKLEGHRLGGNYSAGGSSAIEGDGDKNRWNDWFFNNNTHDFIPPGKVLAYFDTDTHMKNKNDTIHYGNMVLDLFNANVDKRYSGDTELKLSLVALRDGEISESVKKIAEYAEASRSGIGNFVNTLYNLNTFEKTSDRLSIFGKGIVVAPNMKVPDGKKDEEDVGKGKIYNKRMYMDYLYNVVNGKVIPTSSGAMSADSLKSAIGSAQSMESFAKLIFYDSSGKCSPIFLSYLKSMSIKADSDSKADSFGAEDNGESYSRLIKVMPINDTMRIVNNVFGAAPETEFGRWTPMIYATYLEWYGLVGDKSNKLSTTLFVPDNFKIDLGMIETKAKTDEEIKQLMYTYLDPEAGRSIRKSVNMNTITDLVYDWYRSMVYKQTDKGSSSTDGSTGFLTVNTYGENWFTSWFIRNYTVIVIPVMGLSLIGLLIIAVINKRGVFWVLFGMVGVVNALLITPTVGDIVPFVSGNMQNLIFKDRLDFWAISESVEMAKLNNSQDIKDMYGDSVSSEVYNLVKTFNTQYADSSLMLRWDISKKVTETANSNLNELQKYKSTSWMLPMIVRQYSSKEKSEDYVFISMTDALDNAKYMYWYYNQTDRLNSGDTDGVTSAEKLSASERVNLYEGYKDVTSYESGFNSSIVNSTRRDPVHSSFYLLPGLQVPKIDLTQKDSDIRNEVNSIVKNGGQTQGSFEGALDRLERIGGAYNSMDGAVSPEYGYLWTTESPLTYFYMAVKDSFTSNQGLGSVIENLQGSYQLAPAEDGQAEEDREEVRISFMHHEFTGDIKDVVDLEELFTNVVPYLYTTQILAGGVDGESGLFGLNKLTAYELYKDNRQSWLFRSNWATKLIESSGLTKPDNARTSEGKKFDVYNPMLPQCYTDRPMVFSEAQMVEMGLSDFDLTKVELMIKQLNKQIVDKWTLLINYANLDNIDKEIIFQHMALIATTEFNKMFSPGSLFNQSTSLYPRNIELRNVSFDSVIKMLVLNSTRDTGYVYGDVMYNFIVNADIISILLLLIVTAICVFCIPLTSNILSATLLYIGIYSSTINIVSSGKTKVINFAAYMVDLGLFIGLNACYYGAISALMGMSSPADILRINGGIIDISSPTIVLLLLTAISCIYIYLAFKMVVFLKNNKDDMGAHELQANAVDIGNKLGASAKSAGNGIKDFITGDSNIDYKASGGKYNSNNAEKITSTLGTDDINEKDIPQELKESSDVDIPVDAESTGNTSSLEIDREITEGKDKVKGV